MDLLIYGSFNCPYSYLASLRADRLKAAAAAEFEWRAVMHEPDVPPGGTPVSGELAETLDHELEEIRGLLLPGEPYPARCPPVQPNTTAAIAGFSSLQNRSADACRAAIFHAFWANGADIGDRQVLDCLGCPAVAPGETMNAWQAQWSGTDRAVVPMMVLPDGEISRGMDALARLADMDSQSGGPSGGEHR